MRGFIQVTHTGGVLQYVITSAKEGYVFRLVCFSLGLLEELRQKKVNTFLFFH